jgi:hypothetical protein
VALGGVARRGSRRRLAAPGLSKPHISPQVRDESGRVFPQSLDGPKPNLTFFRDSAGALVSIDGGQGGIEWYPGASLVTARKPKRLTVKSVLPAVSHRRGAVSGFSAGSRRRLMHLLGRVKRDHLPVFVTLTYPGDWPGDPKVWKKHLDAIGKRLARRYPKFAAVWKLEPQTRGAPHFHLMTWGCDYDDLRAWLPGSWYEVVGSGDDKHLRAGTRCEFVRSWRGVRSYASKYMGKPVQVEDDSWGRPGRWWGVIGRKNMPFAPVMYCCLLWSQVCTMIRWMRRYMKLKSRDYQSLNCLVESPEVWVDNFFRYCEAFEYG